MQSPPPPGRRRRRPRPACAAIRMCARNCARTRGYAAFATSRELKSLRSALVALRAEIDQTTEARRSDSGHLSHNGHLSYSGHLSWNVRLKPRRDNAERHATPETRCRSIDTRAHAARHARARVQHRRSPILAKSTRGCCATACSSRASEPPPSALCTPNPTPELFLRPKSHRPRRPPGWIQRPRRGSTEVAGLRSTASC